jgi:hypothetical protein
MWWWQMSIYPARASGYFFTTISPKLEFSRAASRLSPVAVIEPSGNAIAAALTAEGLRFTTYDIPRFLNCLAEDKISNQLDELSRNEHISIEMTAMPPEIQIDLSAAFPHSAGAQFLSVIAYPNSADRARRDRLARALCRWEVIKRAFDDDTYANTVQPIPSAIFQDDSPLFWDSLKEGHEKLIDRIEATTHVLVPYLREPLSGDTPLIKKLSESATVARGLSPGSGSNFIMDVWKDTKRVAHATLALWGCCLEFEEFLINPLSLHPIIKLAEQLRPELCTIKRGGKLIFREDEMIKFSLPP